MKTAILWYTGSWSTEVEVADDFEVNSDNVQDIINANEWEFDFNDGTAEWEFDSVEVSRKQSIGY